MEINRENIFELVNKCNARPDKDYGQNFLIEPTIASKIVDALDVCENDKILEIGPGLGSLTNYLSEKGKLTVCDIDSRMIDFLKPVYGDNVSYILDDIRKVDVSNYDKIIGNLPYNITTELVTFLLINATNIKKMVLMCQSEAFNRFYDLSGENYGPVSVLLHLLGESKKLLTVKAGSFYPAPKCSSVVFAFEYSPKADHETAINVYKMCKSLFLNRRKTISNNLKNYLNNNERVEEVLSSLGIDKNTRPEAIMPSQYLMMYGLINKKETDYNKR